MLFSQRNPSHFYSKALLLLLLLLFRARARALSLSLSLSLFLSIVLTYRMSHIVTPSASKPWPRPAPGALALPLKPQRGAGVENAGEEKAHTEGLHPKKEKASMPHTQHTATGFYSYVWRSGFVAVVLKRLYQST